MGWADCGSDEWERPIGYAFPALCDHEGCTVPIDRGLGSCCGSHRSHHDGEGCGLYFCGEHLIDHGCPVYLDDAGANAFWGRWEQRMADQARKALELERVRIVQCETVAEALAALATARLGPAGALTVEFDRLGSWLENETIVMTPDDNQRIARVEDDGYNMALMGFKRPHNPHHEGTPLHRAWDAGWLRGHSDGQR